MRANEVRYQEMQTEDADYIFVAYGLSARICMKAMDIARSKGLKVGIFRPITLFPFPAARLEELASNTKLMLTVELNSGQMVEDVQLAVKGKVPVEFFGKMGGIMPTPEEVVRSLEKAIGK